MIAKVDWLKPHFAEQESHFMVAIAILILHLLSISICLILP
jgi:hypothetical protein